MCKPNPDAIARWSSAWLGTHFAPAKKSKHCARGPSPRREPSRFFAVPEASLITAPRSPLTGGRSPDLFLAN
jgi:hypothetical protein